MFSKILADVYSVFATTEWRATGVTGLPSNYQGNLPPEFARISVLPARGQVFSHGSTKKLSGLVIISLFVKAGDGEGRSFTLAGILSKIMDKKTMANGTQFEVGSITHQGLDEINKALFRVNYSINFTIYGE